MSIRRTTLNVTPATDRQVEALVSRGFGSGLTDIARIAIDRMYQQEIAMSEKIVVKPRLTIVEDNPRVLTIRVHSDPEVARFGLQRSMSAGVRREALTDVEKQRFRREMAEVLELAVERPDAEVLWEDGMVPGGLVLPDGRLAWQVMVDEIDEEEFHAARRK